MVTSNKLLLLFLIHGFSLLKRSDFLARLLWKYLRRSFHLRRSLELLDDYFHIPADGELSDLSDYESDDDNIEELASDRNLVEEQSTILDNIHALDIVDVGESK